MISILSLPRILADCGVDDLQQHITRYAGILQRLVYCMIADPQPR